MLQVGGKVTGECCAWQHAYAVGCRVADRACVDLCAVACERQELYRQPVKVGLAAMHGSECAAQSGFDANGAIRPIRPVDGSSVWCLLNGTRRHHLDDHLIRERPRWFKGLTGRLAAAKSPGLGCCRCLLEAGSVGSGLSSGLFVKVLKRPLPGEFGVVCVRVCYHPIKPPCFGSLAVQRPERSRCCLCVADRSL